MPCGLQYIKKRAELTNTHVLIKVFEQVLNSTKILVCSSPIVNVLVYPDLAGLAPLHFGYKQLSSPCEPENGG